MADRLKQSWCRGAVFAGAVLATAALGLGMTGNPAEAQSYGYRYTHPHWSHSPYGYSHYRGDDRRWRDHGSRRDWNHARNYHGAGPAVHGRAAAPVGSGNAYMSWLGQHGSYR